MKYLSVKELAKKWSLSERTVRNYCSTGKIPDAFKIGKTWNILETARRPKKAKQSSSRKLREVLRDEKRNNLNGGIYHTIQVLLTYNSNHLEGNSLTLGQVRFIYETNTIESEDGSVNVDDIVETINHFKCIDLIIDNANRPLSERFIKQLHQTLKSGTSDSRKDWFAVGDYKKLQNEVGGLETTLPENVEEEIKKLLENYNKNKDKTLEDIIEFHYKFETIHPFQDGNGRIGRLIMFKECLRNNIVPFIIDEDLKRFYYRGLSEWKRERGYLRDTILTAQDNFKKQLDYFRIPYND